MGLGSSLGGFGVVFGVRDSYLGTLSLSKLFLSPLFSLFLSFLVEVTSDDP